MAQLPAGSFWLGSSQPDTNVDERPRHLAQTRAFRLDKLEATAAQLRECVEHGGCDGSLLDQNGLLGKPRHSDACTFGDAARAQHPANCLSWHQATQLCAHLGKRLPTETEWERAARRVPFIVDGVAVQEPGTDTWAGQFPWGVDLPGPGTPLFANLADRSAQRAFPSFQIFQGYDDGFATTAPVGSFPAGATALGIQDLMGNVSEWTASDYDPTAYLLFEGESGSPTGFKVARGAAWDSDPRVVRITRRFVFRPEDRLHSLGVRCAAD